MHERTKLLHGVTARGRRELYRVELQLNRALLKEYALSPDSYPMGWLHPLSLIEFRQSLDEEPLRRLRKAVYKSMAIDPETVSQLAAGVRLATLRDSFNCYACDKQCLHEPLVQCQIDTFKEVKNRHRLKYGVEHFFPKM